MIECVAKGLPNIDSEIQREGKHNACVCVDYMPAREYTMPDEASLRAERHHR